MPEPNLLVIQRPQRPQRQNPTFEVEMLPTLFNLRRNTQYIHDGVEYKVSYTEYESRIDKFRMDHHQAQYEHDCGLITDEQLEEITEKYFSNMCIYYLIDLDGKICGQFNTMTRDVNIFSKRIVINDRVYYYNSDREVRTYADSCVGLLSQDGSEIIGYDTNVIINFQSQVENEQ